MMLKIMRPWLIMMIIARGRTSTITSSGVFRYTRVKRGILNLFFFLIKGGGGYLVSFDFDLYALIKFYYNFIKTVHKKEGGANLLKFIFLLQALDVIIQCIIGLRVNIFLLCEKYTGISSGTSVLYISMYYFRIFFFILN